MTTATVPETRATTSPRKPASALYVGRVRHRRRTPRPHDFDYSLYMLYLDLDELPHAFDGRWLWSVERPNFVSFRRTDYLGPDDVPLDQAVRDLVESETGERPRGPIRLLTQMRILGFVFNPVSIYYCYDADDTRVEAVVTDVGNTPWNERHPYVFRPNPDAREPYRFRFAKQFHVSPFQDMDTDYDWRLPQPGERLHAHMDCRRDGTSFFDATLTMERRPFGGRQLAGALLRFPLMTVKVVYGIYWQALRLWLKRMPFYVHPHLRGEASA